MIAPVDLGICDGYDYAGDGPVAVVLPGAMLAGMPANAFAIEGLRRNGFRVVQVWDVVRDRAADPVRWTVERLDAASAYAGGCDLVVAKSYSTHAAGAVADRSLAAVWLTPVLDEVTVPALRRRTAPALLVGGTADELWDGALARELSPDVLELDGADHGLARSTDAAAVADGVAAFSAGLGRAT